VAGTEPTRVAPPPEPEAASVVDVQIGQQDVDAAARQAP
jgi:hypothetical protein